MFLSFLGVLVSILALVVAEVFFIIRETLVIIFESIWDVVSVLWWRGYAFLLAIVQVDLLALKLRGLENLSWLMTLLPATVLVFAFYFISVSGSANFLINLFCQPITERDD